MSYQEKSIFVNLFSSIVVFGIYGYFMLQMYQEGQFVGEEGAQLVGKSVLWLMGAGIVFHIIAHILFNIIYAIVKRESNPSFVVDERDRLIELRSLRVAYYLLGAGFVGAMVALATGQGVFVAFNILIVSLPVSGLAESLTQLFLYRRGF